MTERKARAGTGESGFLAALGMTILLEIVEERREQQQPQRQQWQWQQQQQHGNSNSTATATAAVTATATATAKLSGLEGVGQG
jgi:hypothetical protein